MLEALHHLLTRTHIVRHHQSVLDAALFMAMLNQVEGDFLEFGVYRGDRMVQAFKTAKALVGAVESGRDPLLRKASVENLKAMRFFGFDSFQGLPRPGEIDVVPGQAAWIGAGEFAATVPEVRRRLKKKGCDEARTVLVDGWFDDTLNEATKTENRMTAAMVVHVDCDFYESAVPALEFCTDLLVDGSIIIFDDWFLFRGRSDRGEQRAFDEWQDRHALKLKPFIPGTAMSFMVER